MKILFVVKSKKMENLGVMYLSAVAKANGAESRIIEINDAPMMTRLWKPDYIGYSIMTGDQHRFQKINEGVQQCRPTPVLIGGPHPTFFPEDCLFGLVVSGEAEDFIAELCGNPKTYDLDTIPWPDRTDFPNMEIRDFITSRGCPYNCTYCYNDRWAKMFPDKRVRIRDVSAVIHEILYVKPKFVYFQDSCFGVNAKWFEDFCSGYGKFVGIPYHCHFRPNQITNKKACHLEQSNCASVRMALETGSDRLRAMIGRANVTNNDVIEASRVLRRHGIKVMIQNILGLPTATIREDLKTLEVNIRCRPSYGWCSIFAPYPGTALGDLAKKEGYYTGDYSELSDSFFDDSVLNFDDLHKEQLNCLQKIFALCVEAEYLPEAHELTYKNFPQLVHKVMRKVGDGRLFPGIF